MSSTVNKRRSIKRFGKKLHRLRIGRGMTLQELADALGLKSHGYISELEAGKKVPMVDFVLQVARYFDVTTDELLKDEVKLKERS
jgi:transcriptional regulator with XRE-family HTH domain